MTAATAPVHVPVLVRETIEALAPKAGGILLDGTVGLGGHALAWLAATTAAGRTGRVLGLDRDQDALAIATSRLSAAHPGCAVLRHASYENAAEACAEAGISPDAALLDLGVSSLQIDRADRGFAFQVAGPLDMRMDRSGDSSETAADFVNRRSEAELARIFEEWGEEPAARKVARVLVEERRRAPFRDTLRLAEVVSRAVGGRKGRLHPATKVFQALRIAVNDELARVSRGLPAVGGTLRAGGRFAVISFHRLEDRAAKEYFDDGARRGVFTLLPGAVPGDVELRSNPRCRSARLRAAEVVRAVREVA